MAEIYKLLGQAAPTIDTLTDLYAVPVGASAVIGTLVMAHIGDANDPAGVCRVSVAVAGAADAAKQVILNDVQLAANVAAVHKLGLTLGPGDVVRVRCREALCAFNLFGTEIAPFATSTVVDLYNAHVAAVDPHGDRAYANAAILAGAPGGATVNPQVLISWAEHVELIDITYDVTETLVMASAVVKWPDGSAGVMTTTAIDATWKAIDAYTLTHATSGLTVTQAAVTRNADGLITHKPELTVA